MTRAEAEQILEQIVVALTQSPVLVFQDEDGCSRQPVISVLLAEGEGGWRLHVLSTEERGWWLEEPTTKVWPAVP